MKRSNRFLITVRGSGIFPIDMLRYDECWPYTEEDAYRCSPDFNGEMRDIELVTNNIRAPNYDRWKSFTWQVVKCTSE